MQEAKAAGCPSGLEAIGPKTGPEMQDTIAIVNMVKALQPDRVLLFNEAPTLLRHKRNGADDNSSDAVSQEVPKRAIEPTTGQIEMMFQLLGYK